MQSNSVPKRPLIFSRCQKLPTRPVYIFPDVASTPNPARAAPSARECFFLFFPQSGQAQWPERLRRGEVRPIARRLCGRCRWLTPTAAMSARVFSQPEVPNHRLPVPVNWTGSTGNRKKPVEFKIQTKTRSSNGSHQYTGWTDQYTGPRTGRWTKNRISGKFDTFSNLN
jgi:hypothetical protein